MISFVISRSGKLTRALVFVFVLVLALALLLTLAPSRARALVLVLAHVLLLVFAFVLVLALTLLCELLLALARPVLLLVIELYSLTNHAAHTKAFPSTIIGKACHQKVFQQKVRHRKGKPPTKQPINTAPRPERT